MHEQIPIFVVSLPDAVQRRASLMAKLEEYELSYKILGVDCRDGVPQVFEPLLCPKSMVKYYGRHLFPAEVGCALSHHMVYRKIRLEGYEAAIVLEDDAIIAKGFAEFARHQPIDPEIDMLLLCHAHAHVSMKCPKSLNVASMAYILKCKSTVLAVGYLVTKRAVDYFIKNSLPLSMIADWPVDLTEIKTFAAHPQLVSHPKYEEGAHSYIEHDRSKFLYRFNGRKRQGLQRILDGTFFKLNYWKWKMEKQKRRLYTKIS
ncbi:MAG: glycosyltransferase family 25 protein [Aestuariivita sp.]|nr:glycosyltransferase family 25 protein [Aestuariivita sp.]